VLFTFTWLYQALMWINVLDPVVEYVYLYGFVGMLVPMSVYLARDFALTNRRLAVQLKEVQRLSELALEQERRARQEEVERRLLEVDNERKTQELEEARQLQTALLPVAGEFGDIDVAFHLTTATEVGGDYYDYVHAEDGSWIFAVGDATGHGARSSLVMATTKGLFNTLAETVEPDQLIEHMAHGIRSMNLGTVFMSLTLVRLEGRRLTVHAAGMPPVHVYRQATGKVDEVLLEAVPLGAVQPGDFPRWQGELHPEDVVLMMTDGLPERVNPDGELLGYERTVTAFAEACQESASGICQRLVQAGDDWARGQVSEDDVTLLAIKVPAVG
jgi:sigma-B regulation protein RsbU (phosphoserine phosphatase)